MKTIYKDQIDAIQDARTLLSGSIVAAPVKLLLNLTYATTTIEKYESLESQVKELREALEETVTFYDRCVENKMFSPILARPIFSKAKQLLNKQP